MVVSQGPLHSPRVWSSHTYRHIVKSRGRPLSRSNACLLQLIRIPGQMTVACPWSGSQVKCLSHGTGLDPRSNVQYVSCPWSGSQVKCLFHAPGPDPRSNVCLIRLVRISGQMSVSCNWTERPRDSTCMIMDNTHKVKLCGCAFRRSNVSCVQLGSAAT